MNVKVCGVCASAQSLSPTERDPGWGDPSGEKPGEVDGGEKKNRNNRRWGKNDQRTPIRKMFRTAGKGLMWLMSVCLSFQLLRVSRSSFHGYVLISVCFFLARLSFRERGAGKGLKGATVLLL